LLFWQVDWPKTIVHPTLAWWNIIGTIIIFFQAYYVFHCHVAMTIILDCNPCIQMWTNLANNELFSHWLFEWLKFIKLSMAMIMGVVEAEKYLLNMGFIKSMLRNRLTTHLDLVVKMFISFLHWIFPHLLQQWIPELLQNPTMMPKDNSNNQKSLNPNPLCICCSCVFVMIFAIFVSFHSILLIWLVWALRCM
jgi:hypothetical protein